MDSSIPVSCTNVWGAYNTNDKFKILSIICYLSYAKDNIFNNDNIVFLLISIVSIFYRIYCLPTVSMNNADKRWKCNLNYISITTTDTVCNT